MWIIRLSERLVCSMYKSIGDNTRSLQPFTPSCGQPLHKQAGRIRLKKEGKPPSFKGFIKQEVIPDWLTKLQKRNLQSGSGTFHFRIEGG